MKVALEAGEVLDIALLDGERVIGTLSLELKGLVAGSRAGRPAGTSAREKSAGAAAEGAGAGRRRKRKPMSAESRARMAEAQRRRWEKNRGPEGESNQ